MKAIAITVALGMLGWIVILVVGQPLRRFFDLREIVRERMLYFANICVPDDGESDALLRQAQQELRGLGTRMLAIANTQPVAAFVMHRLGFDPSDAGSGLIGLSNTLGTYGAERARWRAQIECALKFPT